MAVATANKVSPRLQARLEEETEAVFMEQRSAKITELGQIAKSLNQIAPPLNMAVQAAETDLMAAEVEARRLVADASERLRELRSQKQRDVFPLERRADILNAELTGKFCPQSITDALRDIEAIRETNRRGEDYKKQGSVIAWCDSARQELVELQFKAVPDVDRAVQAIMDTRP